MKPESIIVGIAGALFGLLCGWMLGAQQAGSGTPGGPAAPAAQVAPASAGAQGAQASTAPALDLARVQSLEKQAADQPNDADVRTQLGNLYFDSEKYTEAAKWYEASLKLSPANPDVSTDLAVSYYYSNQVDQALAQFQKSLDINAKHTKTWLNLGIVRAFGKQDLVGAGQAWEKVMELAPADSPEARAAKQALDGLKSAHPETGSAAPATAAPKQGA
ncbi:tetratricopeptide repeat protein [Luteitalea sp.]|jgi:cytochrome c-type biogenesis protein CcmH/NrfG|uniref:tetratricopeptide repeat protein n=1 Tax=Luteitalea sp. TaxID=2004800 RepID=UPI0037CC9721